MSLVVTMWKNNTVYIELVDSCSNLIFFKCRFFSNIWVRFFNVLYTDSYHNRNQCNDSSCPMLTITVTVVTVQQSVVLY